MPLGWFDDLVDAKAYFTNERVITTAWDNLASDAIRTKAVTNAYNRLYYDPAYSLPTYVAATAAQLIVLKKANGEMAYYLAQHLDDEDRRKGIQIQGTVKAGIVKEDYDKDWLDNLPVPPFVDALLGGFKTTSAFHVVEIGRDENLGIDEDATDSDF